MASVNKTRPHCVNQMGKTHSKPLAPRHGRGTAWARHAMCESALSHPRLSVVRIYLVCLYVTWPVFMQSCSGYGEGGGASARECVCFVIRLGRGQCGIETGMLCDG
jgi:hypothetical protein